MVLREVFYCRLLSNALCLQFLRFSTELVPPYRIVNNVCVFVADTAKTGQGFISLKAYRLTPEAIKMFKENDFSPDYVKVSL